MIAYFGDHRKVLSYTNGQAVLHTYMKWLHKKADAQTKQTSGASLGGAPTDLCRYRGKYRRYKLFPRWTA